LAIVFFRHFLKITKLGQIYLFSAVWKIVYKILTKIVLGFILGDSFKNSSGHPADIPNHSVKYFWRTTMT
jgi:hypothetical protein